LVAYPTLKHQWEGPIYRLHITQQSLAIGQRATIDVEAAYSDGVKSETDGLLCDWHTNPQLLVAPVPDGCTLAITDLPIYFPAHGVDPIAFQVTATRHDDGHILATDTITLYPLGQPQIEARTEMPFGTSTAVRFRVDNKPDWMQFKCTWRPYDLFDDPNSCAPHFRAPANAGSYPTKTVGISVQLHVSSAPAGDRVTPPAVSVTSSDFTIQLTDAPNVPPPTKEHQKPPQADPGTYGERNPPQSPSATAPPRLAVIQETAPQNSVVAADHAGLGRPTLPRQPAGATVASSDEPGEPTILTALREEASRLPQSQRLSVNEALRQLDTLSGSDARRSGLNILLPHLELPLPPRDALRLLDGITGADRTSALMDVGACIARPIPVDIRAALLNGIGGVYRESLGTELRTWSNCRLRGGTGGERYYLVTVDTYLYDAPEPRFSTKLTGLRAGNTTVRAFPDQTGETWLRVETDNGLTGYVNRNSVIQQTN
jgi:hypothetical protein